jgi:hypothetical protein
MATIFMYNATECTGYVLNISLPIGECIAAVGTRLDCGMTGTLWESNCNTGALSTGEPVSRDCTNDGEYSHHIVWDCPDYAFNPYYLLLLIPMLLAIMGYTCVFLKRRRHRAESHPMLDRYA